MNTIIKTLIDEIRIKFKKLDVVDWEKVYFYILGVLDANNTENAEDMAHGIIDMIKGDEH